MAGILALGVAACGDDVQVVEPTPPQPPPPPPVTATMAPASASVAVGNSVVFAVNASGGVAGEAASWTCASSNTGIATVTSTSAGCSATGVAAGDVTITASVSKSGETVNVGAQLTVTAEEVVAPPQAGDPAFILIKSINGGESPVSGDNIKVVVGVERGDQELEELSLLVDGAVVASQSFGGGMDMGMAPPTDEPAEQAVHDFTLSFNSADYDRESGAPTYMNGEHTISAELEIGVDMADGTHGHETISSNAITVEFKNSNFVGVSIAGLGDGAMNSNTGQRWYGGPGVTPEITAVPVSYSGGDAVASLTLLSICGADAATDSEAPFVFTVECKKGQSKETLEFNVEGETIEARGDKEVYLDFQAPTAPHFYRAEDGSGPNGREDGWVNAAVQFTSKYEDKDGKRDGWLVYNDKDTDNPASAGIGGYMPQLRYSSTTPSIVDGARAATPNVLPTAATKKDAVCVIATAVDLLGNESTLPEAGSGCATADKYVADADGDYPAGLRAGLDVTPPTIAFSGTSPTKNDRNLSSQFQFQVGEEKDGSGLPDNPVEARVEIRNAKNEVVCGDDSAEKKDLPGNEDIRGNCINTSDGLAYDNVLDLVTTSGLPTTNPAYYTLTAVGRDKAGNYSEPVSRVALHDDGKPAVSLIGGTYDATKAVHNLIINVTDNFSIRDYYVALQFPGNTLLPDNSASTPTSITTIRLMNPIAVDGYNSDELTKSADAGGAYNAFVALQGTDVTGSDPEVHGLADFTEFTADDDRAVAVYARDQSHGNRRYSSPKSDAVDVAFAATDGFPEATPPNTATAMVTNGIESFTFETDETTYDVEDTIELTAEVVGYSRDAKGIRVIGADDTAEGITETDDLDAEDAVPFRNPFKRVDFYAVSKGPQTGNTDTDDDELRFIASVGATGTASESIDEDDDGVDDLADGADDATADGDDDSLSAADERANADNKVTFSYGVEVSAADFYAAVQDSGKGDYSGEVIAIGVSATNKDLTAKGGVGLVSQATSITIDK